MRVLLPLLLFLAQPFWEARPPERWTNAEIEEIRTRSPWAQPLEMGTPATAYLATALPIEHAEAELRLRTKKNPQPLPEPDHDYLDYMREHRDQAIVLGVTYPRMNSFGKPGEDKRMEEETVMIIGKTQHHIIGHFPPTPSDSVLRLIFPRAVKPTDKNVLFRLYLPGLSFPEREVVFTLKDLTYQGKLAM